MMILYAQYDVLELVTVNFFLYKKTSLGFLRSRQKEKEGVLYTKQIFAPT